MAVLVFTIFLLSVSVFAADTEGVEEGGSSLDIQVTALPEITEWLFHVN